MLSEHVCVHLEFRNSPDFSLSMNVATLQVSLKRQGLSIFNSKSSPEFRLSMIVSLQVSLDREDWGICTIHCKLLNYRNIQQQLIPGFNPKSNRYVAYNCIDCSNVADPDPVYQGSPVSVKKSNLRSKQYCSLNVVLKNLAKNLILMCNLFSVPGLHKAKIK